jgi:hypothetical protein
MTLTSTGELLRFRCTSETQAKKDYLCDVLENHCECPSYTFKAKPSFICKHLRKARELVLDEMLEQIRKHQNK